MHLCLDLFEPMWYILCRKGERKAMKRTVTAINAAAPQEGKIRTAAYCRVSSDSADQLHSFSAQVRYYTRLIGDNECMELVDIYADEGISGTKTKNRDDFCRLINDCKNGKIDRVLTKSVSRFARNTVDSIMYARLLKENGVSILFEKENIDTAYMSNEVLLAVSGAQAEEESISISKNMIWSINRRMKNGTYLASHTPYGYRIENGEYVIVEDEAEVVKQIFKNYLSGVAKKTIADMLNSMNVPNREGTPWQRSTVEYILGNERYTGNAVFQKTYTDAAEPFKNKPNNGKVPKYFVEDTNPPIISKKEYEAAVRLTEERRNRKPYKKTADRTLNGKIRCSCGGIFGRKTVSGKAYWSCNIHESDSGKCNSRRVPEDDIYEAYITAVNKLREYRCEILLPAIQQTENLYMRAGNSTLKIKEIDREIAELSDKNILITRLHSKGIIRSFEYSEQISAVNSKITALRKERTRLFEERDENGTLSGLKTLNNRLTDLKKPLTEFDSELFAETVKGISVPNNGEVRIEFAGGLTVSEKIPDRRRCREK